MELNNLTQVERVMLYMQKHGSITQFEAMNDLGVMRLASRISDIKKAGTVVYKKNIKVKNRFNEDVTVTRYSLDNMED